MEQLEGEEFKVTSGSLRKLPLPPQVPFHTHVFPQASLFFFLPLSSSLSPSLSLSLCLLSRALMATAEEPRRIRPERCNWVAKTRPAPQSPLSTTLLCLRGEMLHFFFRDSVWTLSRCLSEIYFHILHLDFCFWVSTSCNRRVLRFSTLEIFSVTRPSRFLCSRIMLHGGFSGGARFDEQLSGVKFWFKALLSVRCALALICLAFGIIFPFLISRKLFEKFSSP